MSLLLRQTNAAALNRYRVGHNLLQAVAIEGIFFGVGGEGIAVVMCTTVVVKAEGLGSELEKEAAVAETDAKSLRKRLGLA